MANARDEKMETIEVSKEAYKFYKDISDKTGTPVYEVVHRWIMFVYKNQWILEPPYLGKGGSRRLKDGYDPSKWTKEKIKIIKTFFEIDFYR